MIRHIAFALLLAVPQDPPRPPGGPGGGPGPMQAERKILAQFDKNQNGRLESDERAAAREQIKKDAVKRPAGGRPMGGPGRQQRDPAKPGPKVAVADVKPLEGAFYEPTVLRTLFLDFEAKDWEEELTDFHNTDVDVPCKLTVDGKAYADVGISFRGASSYFMVPAGYKRSLNLSIDHADEKQRLHGLKTLNLLNCNGDASFLSTALYSHIARQYLPAPKANFVKVVINGESWGIYANVEQFNRDFLQANYKTTKGVRWKVPGSPNATSGLDYIGDDIAAYKKKYEIKTGDDDASWKALVKLCKILTEVPADKAEEALKPILDIDGALRFLALDVALINSDGYWVRSSDYSIYLDEAGIFHVLPGDMNEAFRPAGGGPGMRGKPAGFELDPLTGLDDVKKPLRSKLLAVPALKEKYLEYVRAIAKDWLDWKKLGPIVAQHRALLEKEIEADTRKLATFDAFKKATDDATGSLRTFADKRRAYLLEH